VEYGFSVQKWVGQVNGKDGWWLVVKASEKYLLKGEKVWQHKYWYDLCQFATEVNASSSLEGEGEVDGAGEGVDKEAKKSEGKLSKMCWNVCGRCKGLQQIDQMRENLDIRAEVIDFYRPEIVKTWLKGDEEVVVEGYKWFENNRKYLHGKAVKGSGGVGVLIREEVLKRYQVEILEAEIEDILLNQGEEEDELVFIVCYVPPESSSCGRSSDKYFQILAEQMESLECLDHWARS